MDLPVHFHFESLVYIIYRAVKAPLLLAPSPILDVPPASPAFTVREASGLALVGGWAQRCCIRFLHVHFTLVIFTWT